MILSSDRPGWGAALAACHMHAVLTASAAAEITDQEHFMDIRVS
jgi:hypothetical protein